MWIKYSSFFSPDLILFTCLLRQMYHSWINLNLWKKKKTEKEKKDFNRKKQLRDFLSNNEHEATSQVVKINSKNFENF